MCIVIDINVLPSVFKKDSENHQDFQPVFNWIYQGKGKVVYGGSKYLEELSEKYRKMLLQLNKAGKAIFISNSLVDKEAESASKLIIHDDFDDAHIVGLLKASGCKLICSLDARAYPFFQHSLFFSPARKRPKIYFSLINANLLNDTNIARICKPCVSTTKLQRKILNG